MIRDNLLYIGHIKDCIIKIEQYTEQYTLDGFLKSSIVQDAVIRNFEIIGEATKKLSPDLRDKYSDIEWKKIAGMRDKLIHDYIGVDMWAVWAVVTDIIPGLRLQIERILDIENKR